MGGNRALVPWIKIIMKATQKVREEALRLKTAPLQPGWKEERDGSGNVIYRDYDTDNTGKPIVLYTDETTEQRAARALGWTTVRPTLNSLPKTLVKKIIEQVE